ncbi:MAG: hypothetical protein JWM34_1561 [Ilumatobacteraceae bacterium]|nr:hypothetical protein [Ilumatobacteraceae bacterium]
MTAKRLLAFLGAVVLIVGAIVLRSALDDNSSSSTSGSGTTSSGGKATVVCSIALAVACDELDPKKFDVAYANDGDEFTALSQSGAQVPDAWITVDPFPGMVDAQRSFTQQPELTSTVTAVAADAPMLAVASTDAKDFAQACLQQPAWKCIGSNAGRSWASIGGTEGGDLLPGLRDPDADGIGLLTFANAVAGYFGNATLSTTQWDDGAFTSWLRNLHSGTNNRTATGRDSSLATLIVRPTLVNVAATTASELTANAQSTRVTALPVAPAVSITAVVAAYTTRGARVPAAIAPLLVAAHWTATTAPAQTLDAGTFVALRALWEGK